MNLRLLKTSFASSVIALALALAGCAAPSQRYSVQGAQPPSSMQWLYSSGEAAYLQKTIYSNMTDFVAAAVSSQHAQDIVISRTRSASPSRGGADCGTKPPAVIFDIDETVILNLGYERYLSSSGLAYNSASWNDWERSGSRKVAPVPGVIDAMARLDRLGVTPVFVSDRSAEHVSETIDALAFAGVAKPLHLRNLFLKGDISDRPGKDDRRAHVSSTFCVIALVGDQLGDFSDDLVKQGRFAVRRAEADPWGKGWFLLPNPVYGSGVRGDLETVIPSAFDWHPRVR